MGNYAIPRKKRKTKNIKISEELYRKFMKNKDYRKAALVVFWCVLKDFGKEGIINALDYANSFYKRKKLRRGL